MTCDQYRPILACASANLYQNARMRKLICVLDDYICHEIFLIEAACCRKIRESVHLQSAMNQLFSSCCRKLTVTVYI